MKVKDLEKLFKDKLVKDGISKDWLDKKFIVLGSDNEEEEE